MEGKRGAQLERMKVVRIFNPLHVLSVGSAITDTDIDALSIFRFSAHPKIKPALKTMKDELPKYLSKVNEIKPLAQRKDSKGKDTFDLHMWWKGNYGEFPAWGYVLRAVLTNSPNSIPPERVFSILNDTFGDDQKTGGADYKEFSLMKQYNARGRK
jgi:hypothetical protein